MMTAGIEGYERHISRFVKISQALDFQGLCSDFIRYMPPVIRSVLDVRSGAGQHAAALDELSFEVTEIEPMSEFFNAARNTYINASVK